jgi:hypothetical protein
MELEAEERGSLPCMACSVDYVGPLGPKGLLLMEAAHRIPLSMPVAREEATIEDFWTACKPCNALQEVDKLGFDSFLERYEGVLFGTFEVAV